MTLTAANRKFVARQFGGTKLAKAIDSDVFGSGLQPRHVTASATAAIGDLVLVDATAANVTITAPDPSAGGRFAIKLFKTASSHTMGVAGHASEKFDGTTAPSASSTVGALWTFQSDGTDWFITSKI